MSPTQEEILEQAKVDEMRNLAGEKDIDLEGARTRDEIMAKLVASRKVSKAELEDRFGDRLEEAPPQVTDEQAGREVVGPTRVTRSPEAILDPALTDPEGVARDRVEGRTSDPANRAEGVTAAEVPPDISQGPKQSDAGPIAYPFPPGGDVDVALVDPGNSSEEYPAPLNVDDWVVLDGAHELVPDRLGGHIAYVIEAPNETAPDVHDHPNAARTPVPDAGITVRTRDEVNATLVLPMEAFKAVGRGGRSAVVPIG